MDSFDINGVSPSGSQRSQDMERQLTAQCCWEEISQALGGEGRDGLIDLDLSVIEPKRKATHEIELGTEIAAVARRMSNQ